MKQDVRKEHKPSLSQIINDLDLITSVRKQRVETIEELLLGYVCEFGVRPRNQDLELLADLILYEELHDSNPHKVTHHEYPILSLTQLKRRMHGRGASAATNMKGELRLDIHESSRKDAPPKHADVAADGRRYHSPTRRTRSLYELMWVDDNTVSRHPQRSEQYVKDSSAGQVHTYMLRKNILK